MEIRPPPSEGKGGEVFPAFTARFLSWRRIIWGLIWGSEGKRHQDTVLISIPYGYCLAEPESCHPPEIAGFFGVGNRKATVSATREGIRAYRKGEAGSSGGLCVIGASAAGAASPCSPGGCQVDLPTRRPPLTLGQRRLLPLRNHTLCHSCGPVPAVQVGL
jgi:hypothetical protein